MARRIKRHNLTTVEAENLKQEIYAGEADNSEPDCSACRYLADDWTCMHPETTEAVVLRVQFEGIICEHFHGIRVTDFFVALDAMDEVEEVIEVTGHLENGQLVLHESQHLPVKDNEILLGNRRIVIRLQNKIA